MELDGALGSVLIVDDELGVRTALRMLLEPSYRVILAENGDRALELLAQGGIDVVALDLRMPGMDGVSTLRRIRQVDPDVEVVIMTGYASYDTAIECLRLHSFDYVEKPFDSHRMMNVVRRATAARAARPRRTHGVVDPSVTELVAAVEALVRPGAAKLDRATRHKLDHLQLLAWDLRDRLMDSPQGIVPEMIEELDALAARPDLFDEPALTQIRELARDLERRQAS